MNFPEIRPSLSALDTEAVGEELARCILENKDMPRFIALFGDLGVGKTAFVRGFTRAIAPDARVKSPTFALVNEYKGAKLSVYHFDMYRIEDEDSLYSIGFFDYLDGNGICLTEWSENIEYALPDSYFKVEITKDNADHIDSRRIDISRVGI